MSDFDVNAILAGSVTKISAGLAELTPEQRKALHDAEEKREGGPRTTLLAAIHAFDDDGSIAAAKAKEAEEQAAKEKAEADAAAKEKADADAAEQAKQDAEAQAKADADAKAKAKADAAAEKAAAKRRPLTLADLPDPTALKEVVDYHGAVTVVLADADDVPIADWPPLEFPADKIEAAENGVRLTEQIDMAAELPPAQVKAFWLTVGGEAVAVARLAVPLPAGGGRRAQMGAGSLRFRNDG